MRTFSQKSNKKSSGKTQSSSYSSESENETNFLENSKANFSAEPRKLRTPCSIPNRSAFSNYENFSVKGTSKQRTAVNMKSPSLLIEYNIPSSPEKYLLPIRFPVLYNNIIRNLLKNKAVNTDIRSVKLIKQNDKGQKYILFLV